MNVRNFQTWADVNPHASVRMPHNAYLHLTRGLALLENAYFVRTFSKKDLMVAFILDYCKEFCQTG